MQAHLFEPLQLKSVLLKNRIVMSPMCEYSSVDGLANDWHFVHLGSRAVGGAGLVFTEAAAVSAEGRITPADLGIWGDGHVEPLEKIFRFVAEHGAVAGVQLAHAGRKASTSEPWKGGEPLTVAQGGWTPIYAPSALAFTEGWQVPTEMTAADIQKITRDYAAAAQRAHAAGAKVIEIHAAHGYLLHSFLSPLSNQRKDQYGGSFANRIRIVCETIEAVRKVWPEDLPISMRISATDWTEGGWDIEQSVELARRAKALGIDVIDCSTGGNVPKAKIPVGAGYQVTFAERIRREAGIKTAAVGMITEAEQADQIVRTEQADLVLLAREFLRKPYWPLEAAWRLQKDVKWPQQYARAAKPVVQR